MTPPGKKPLGASFWKELMGEGARSISEDFRPLLACPDDDAPLEYRSEEGLFRCPACSRVYTMEDGVLPLLPSADPYQLDEEETRWLAGEARAANRPLDDPAASHPRIWEHVAGERFRWRNKVVVELCAGTGWFGLDVARRGAKVALLDIVAGEGGLRTAGERAQQAGVEVDLLQGDVCRIPLAEESVDAVVVAGGVSAQRRPERMMREVGRILKPDGVCLDILEPTGKPVPAGRRLSVADYRGIFAEGGLEMECLFPGDAGGKPSGLFGKVRQALRERRPSADCLFVGRKPEPFDLFEWLSSWRKKRGQ